MSQLEAESPAEFAKRFVSGITPNDSPEQIEDDLRAMLFKREAPLIKALSHLVEGPTAAETRDFNLDTGDLLSWNEWFQYKQGQAREAAQESRGEVLWSGEAWLDFNLVEPTLKAMDYESAQAWYAIKAKHDLVNLTMTLPSAPPVPQTVNVEEESRGN